MAVFVSVRTGDGEVDRADRLGLGAASGAGDAGDADAPGRAEALADSVGQCDRDRLGDFAVLADQRRIDTDELRLRGGGVANDAAEVIGGAAGDIGDA